MNSSECGARVSSSASASSIRIRLTTSVRPLSRTSFRTLWLFAFARNTGARAFYEKHDFKIIARGFEPNWHLDDIRYEWIAEDAVS